MIRYSVFSYHSGATSTQLPKTFHAMSFLIDPYDFAAEFPERILNRGYTYWSSAAIAHITDDGLGNWTATVVGSQNYLVKISPSADEMVMCSCTCPYAEDAPCKHIAAVLLELEELEVEFGRDESVEEELKPAPGSFEDFLERSGRDQLAGFIRSVCGADPLLHHKFMAYMTPSDESSGKPEFRKIIQAGLESAKWQGYSYDEEFMDASGPAYDLLEQAEVLKKKGEWKTVIDISQIVIEEMVPALEYIDDYYGEIGSAISLATDLLWEAADQSLDSELQANYFSWCMESIRSNSYKDWDTQTDLMAIAGSLAHGQEQVSELEAFLDARIENINHNRDGYNWRYHLEVAISFKIELLKVQGRIDEANKLMEKYRHLPRILEMLLMRAWEEGLIARVEELAENAIKTHGKELPGLISGWLEWLVKVAEARRDPDLLQIRLKDVFSNTPNMENFRRLKKAVPAERWPEVYEGLIRKLKQGSRSFYIIPDIYEEENRMEDLLTWLKKNPGFDALNRYAHHFKKTYAELIFSMYETLIRQLLANNTGRKYYRDMAQILKNLSRSGYSGQVATLVEDLRDHYNNRPALQDEFRKL